MHTKVFVYTLFLLGCTPSFKSGAAKINRGLVEIKQALESESKHMEIEITEAIDHCRSLNLPTAAQRKACLGKWGEPLPLEAVKSMRDVYNCMVNDLRALEQAYATLKGALP